MYFLSVDLTLTNNLSTNNTRDTLLKSPEQELLNDTACSVVS